MSADTKPHPSPISLSSPATWREWVDCRVDFASYTQVQCLFGAEAQLSAFGHVIATIGLTSQVLAFPEMVSTPISRERSVSGLPPDGPRRETQDAVPRRETQDAVPRRETQDAVPRRETQDAVPRRALHFRFGPPATQRVLKGGETVAVIAGPPTSRGLALGRHPFGREGAMPAAIRRVLVYAEPDPGDPRDQTRDQAGAWPPAPIGLDVLPAGFVDADLPERNARGGDRTALIDSPGIAIQSFSDFDAAAWQDTATPPRSPAWRAHLLETLLGGATPAPGMILLPWNLANPGSAIPDVLGKLAAFSPGQADEAPLVMVAPFNEPVEGLTIIKPILDNLLRESLRAGERLYVARLSQMAKLEALLSLCRGAWVDANDPEADWTLRRLQALGLPSLTLATDSARPSAASIAADDEIRATTSDEFGTRQFSIATLSVRRLRLLVERSRSMAESAPAATRRTRLAEAGAWLDGEFGLARG